MDHKTRPLLSVVMSHQRPYRDPIALFIRYICRIPCYPVELPLLPAMDLRYRQVFEHIRLVGRFPWEQHICPSKVSIRSRL